VAPSAKFILNNIDGKTWPVELVEIDGRVFVITGWPFRKKKNYWMAKVCGGQLFGRG
jgi:hypothetical protein